MGYHEDVHLLVGFKFYDKNGVVVFATRWDWVKIGFKTHTEHLEDGERVIGYKSRIQYKDYASHFDFQFVIGFVV